MNSSIRSFIATALVYSVTVWGQIGPSHLPGHIENAKRGESAKPTRSFNSISKITIGAYNLENLFEEEGGIYNERALPSLPSLLPLENARKDTLKSYRAVAGAGRAILDIGYDILVVEEVENIDALQAFNEEFLNNEYTSYLIEGNDIRGIDIGFLVRDDLPLYAEERTHKFETWKDPTEGGKERKLFSRDLPVMLFSQEENGPAAFAVFGTHFKSKIDRPNDPESRILRGAQADRASTLIHTYQTEFGADVPILFAGDFNGVVNEEPEFKNLKLTAKLNDSFDEVSPALLDSSRITHCYFPKDQPAIYSQLDAVLVNKAAESMILNAKVYRYKDDSGKEWPLPKTYQQVHMNPSDHFPVYGQFDFQRLAGKH